MNVMVKIHKFYLLVLQLVFYSFSLILNRLVESHESCMKVLDALYTSANFLTCLKHNLNGHQLLP